MKQMKRIIGLVCACTMMLSTTAFAANHDFEFKFDNLDHQQTASYAKSDNDQNWYISFDTQNGAVRNNMSSANIFGCKMHRTKNDGVDVYHTFSNYVSRYPIKYSARVAKDDQMYMVAKKDSASTSVASLNISGRFAP